MYVHPPPRTRAPVNVAPVRPPRRLHSPTWDTSSPLASSDHVPRRLGCAVPRIERPAPLLASLSVSRLSSYVLSPSSLANHSLIDAIAALFYLASKRLLSLLPPFTFDLPFFPSPGRLARKPLPEAVLLAALVVVCKMVWGFEAEDEGSASVEGLPKRDEWLKCVEAIGERKEAEDPSWMWRCVAFLLV